MKSPRDLTMPQFAAACERAGFRPEGFMGYYRLPVPTHTCVSVLNAGPRRRDQLAYLHQRLDHHLKELREHPELGARAPGTFEGGGPPYDAATATGMYDRDE